jgi:hypothetical protein
MTARRDSAAARPSLGYRPPPTRLHALGDIVFGLAFWCGFAAMVAGYLGMIP